MLFRTILADPPWKYDQALGRGKSAGDKTRGGLPYSSMSTEDIAGLEVAKLADEDCMLFLWSTNSHIHEALHVMAAWGFSYKTMVTWVKDNIGLGYWVRGRTEHLLMGTKGRPRGKMKGPHGATGKSWSTAIQAPREEHSKKPGIFYYFIEDISEEPRIELFATRKRHSWVTLGGVVDGMDIREAMAKINT